MTKMYKIYTNSFIVLLQGISESMYVQTYKYTKMWKMCKQKLYKFYIYKLIIPLLWSQ